MSTIQQNNSNKITNIALNTPDKYAKALVKRSNAPAIPTPQDLLLLSEVCKTLAQTPFYAKLGPGGVLALWLTATELGIPPMMALNGGLWTFDGKVTMSTQCMNFMIVTKGHRADIVELNDEKCIIKFVRSDRTGKESEFYYPYTIKDAEKAQLLHKDNWKKNRRDMLFNRCLSGGARKFMPDVLMQAYTYEEMCDSDSNFEMAYKTKDQNWDEQQSKPEQQKLVEVVKPVEDITKSEAYVKFKTDMSLNDEKGLGLLYIREIAKIKEKSDEEIIVLAMENQERFETGFNKWLEGKMDSTD